MTLITTGSRDYCIILAVWLVSRIEPSLWVKFSLVCEDSRVMKCLLQVEQALEEVLQQGTRL